MMLLQFIENEDTKYYDVQKLLKSLRKNEDFAAITEASFLNQFNRSEVCNFYQVRPSLVKVYQGIGLQRSKNYFVKLNPLVAGDTMFPHFFLEGYFSMG